MKSPTRPQAGHTTRSAFRWPMQSDDQSMTVGDFNWQRSSVAEDGEGRRRDQHRRQYVSRDQPSPAVHGILAVVRCWHGLAAIKTLEPRTYTRSSAWLEFLFFLASRIFPLPLPFQSNQLVGSSQSGAGGVGQVEADSPAAGYFPAKIQAGRRVCKGHLYAVRRIRVNAIKFMGDREHYLIFLNWLPCRNASYAGCISARH
ncbi:amino acid/amide ABC transporter membrane protein 1, HAAT family [Anopheles sinensis]|uniref:Amino acid/amide ABC transporter membrane protein 1, HAAT family n=1 Tax=Anopheles sinensis TaxID=74873 RepID=A0A084VYW3_ANOSI|nr:amino acid/amide ABC transporter membrane protein 1, HAAT family [Anopheles sinensis]